MTTAAPPEPKPAFGGFLVALAATMTLVIGGIAITNRAEDRAKGRR